MTVCALFARFCQTTEEREAHAVTLAGVVLGAILVTSEIYQFIYAVPTYEVSVPFPAALCACYLSIF